MVQGGVAGTGEIASSSAGGVGLVAGGPAAEVVGGGGQDCNRRLLLEGLQKDVMPGSAPGEAALGPDLVVAGAGSVGMDPEAGRDLLEAHPGLVQLGDRLRRHGQAGPAGRADRFAGSVEDPSDRVAGGVVLVGESEQRRALAVAGDDGVDVHSAEPMTR